MSTAIEVGAALAHGAQALADTGDSPRLDAELLLATAMGKPREYLYAWPDTPLGAGTLEHYETLLARRAAGEPIGYLLGWRQFWSLDLQVTPAVLIPRADTELLVEQALRYIPERAPTRVADVGTGSGAIALAIAAERPHAAIIATDVSTEGLDVARANAARLDVANVEFRAGSLCAPLDGEAVDVLVSNPPYVASGDAAFEADGVRYEPRLALDGGADGLQVIRALAGCAAGHVAPGGRVLVEHGADQGATVRALFGDAGFTAVDTATDPAGHERVTHGART